MSDLRFQLEAIATKHGGFLTREAVVIEAEDPQHPLHHRFEWDDTEAARKFRLNQAGELIRSLRVIYREDETEKASVRAFVSRPATEHKPRRYEPIEAVMADPVARALLLQEARREWLVFRRKFQHLQEFSDIVAGVGDEASTG